MLLLEFMSFKLCIHFAFKQLYSFHFNSHNVCTSFMFYEYVLQVSRLLKYFHSTLPGFMSKSLSPISPTVMSQFFAFKLK
jgi:hypothetical protein